MMKSLLSIICLVFYVFPVIAQEDADQATVRCYYLFSQKQKAGDKEVVVNDTMTLDIGSQMSRYYDESRIQRDSVFGSVLSNLNLDRIKQMSVIKSADPIAFDHSLGDTYRNNTNDGISEQIYKNRKTGNMTLLNISGIISSERYKGSDPVGMLNWTIASDTAVFFNYPCQKANLHFRGRDYEAWFTSQIPINDGPWKFFGLPGLILNVKDTGGQFDFECIGLEYLSAPYVIKIPEYKYFECNRKDFNKIMNKKGGGEIININDGSVTIASFDTETGKNFQSIELE
jgi:GLPGLI family protein